MTEVKGQDASPAVEKFIPFSKKKSTKITLASLIAAAIVSTAVTAHALGGFGEAFADMFIEDSPTGIYSGEDITVESENTNVEFIGVAGNNEMASTAVTLTRKDGKPYVDDTADSWIAASSSDELSGYFFGYVGEQVSISSPSWVRARYDDDDSGGNIETIIDYYFEDASTIAVSTFTSGVYGGIRGETMTLNGGGLSAYKVKKVVYDLSEHLDEYETPEEYSLDDHYREALHECIDKYGTERRNGVILVSNPMTNDLVLAEETPLDIDFTLSVKLAYKISETRFEAVNLAKAVEGWGSGTKGSFRATPFNVTLDVSADIPTVQDFWTFGLTSSANSKETEDQATGMGRFVEYLHYNRPKCPDVLTITLSDGTSVTGVDLGLDNGDVSSGKYSVVYQLYTDETKTHPATINVNDINTIEANGTVVYTK